MGTNQLYLYGITQNDCVTNQFIELKSLGLQVVQYEKISAIVAEKEFVSLAFAGKEKLAKMLVDHQKVLESLMEKGFSMLIPMRIGTYSETQSEVQKILERGYTLCLDILEKTGNMIEVDIAVTWRNLNNVLQTIATDPDIDKYRQELLKKGRAISSSDQIQIGKLIKKKLDEKAVETKQKIIERLKPYSNDLRQHELMNDQMVANVAFLLDKEEGGTFETAVNELDRELGGELNFKYVGPLPCYSFYTLEIVELNFSEVEDAKNELGLHVKASSKEIKHAYLSKVKSVHPDVNSGDGNEAYFTRVNKAWKIINDYMQTVKQSSSDDLFYFTEERVAENSLLVKVRE
jgi:hypothetical protein